MLSVQTTVAQMLELLLQCWLLVKLRHWYILGVEKNYTNLIRFIAIAENFFVKSFASINHVFTEGNLITLILIIPEIHPKEVLNSLITHVFTFETQGQSNLV